MINSENLKKLCRISGFEISDNQANALSGDFSEIIGIMDKIKGWEDNSCNATAPNSMEELREDKPTEPSLVVTGDISIGRVVQDDD